MARAFDNLEIPDDKKYGRERICKPILEALNWPIREVCTCLTRPGQEVQSLNAYLDSYNAHQNTGAPWKHCGPDEAARLIEVLASGLPGTDASE